MSTKNIGLRDIEVADTKICSIDGKNGKLTYRGYDIFDLASSSTFEETCYLLLHGDLPTPSQMRDLDQRLRRAREIPAQLVRAMQERSKSASPMDVLLSSVAMLPDFDEGIGDESKEANDRRAIDLIAKFPTIIAAWDNIRHDRPVVEPSKDLGHAANILYMLAGKEPDKEIARDFDVCLILHAEHSFNASTFAARQVASTRAHIYSSIAAGIGALSGELHGGANTKVMKALLEVGSVERVEPWVKAKMDAGDRIMGMGHAVYSTDDPRAKVLREMSRRLALRTKTRWYEITQKIEDLAKEEMERRKGIEIFANVDLYSASIYYTMGIPLDLNTPIFAIARIAGWTAHVIEEKFAEAQPKPMLYRPKATYVGRYCGPLGCEYTPLNRRDQSSS